MTENNTETTTAAAKAKAEYDAGTWQDTMHKSAVLADRSAKGKKRAGEMLWSGAKAAINEWLPEADSDASAEGLNRDVLEVLGKSRKGDVSKICTVARAVVEHSLDLAEFESLAKAYAEATRLTKTVKTETEEDDAAEAAIEAIDAPKTASTVEAAAKIVLSKGIDGAVVAILDALGAENEAAHRSFMRAVSAEISARTQAKADAVAEAKRAEQEARRAEAEAKRVAALAEKAAKQAAKPAKKVAAKRAPAAKKAAPTPVSRTKGDPNKRAVPVKRATPAKRAVPVKRG